MNAIFFYHFMEFSSDTPPENLVAYFAVEGPYILSMLMVVLKVFVACRQESFEKGNSDGDSVEDSTSSTSVTILMKKDEKKNEKKKQL